MVPITHLQPQQLPCCCLCRQPLQGQCQARHAAQHVERQPPAGRVVLALAGPAGQWRQTFNTKDSKTHYQANIQQHQMARSACIGWACTGVQNSKACSV
jgi:hypothetical protein